MQRLTIAGVIAGLAVGTFVLVATAQQTSKRAPFSPGIKGEPVIEEWYSTYQDYMQKIRTPAPKGLRFNRFIADSHKNTKNAGDPACDFLLHDGRACDAIEAAFLHDGPAVKKLGAIDGLTALTRQPLLQLRAFLYSL